MRHTFIRFCLVGLLNTALDVVLFAALHGAGLSIFAANFVSTSAALCNSLVLNSRYTFRSGLGGGRIAGFFAVTLTGIWLLQPLVIIGLLELWPSLGSTLAKLLALGITFAWNYIWYSKVVFEKEQT
jgi:putative flippase GtrA